MESKPNIPGLRDINTENPLYQDYLVTFLNTLIDAGCDGFRFDTAKHIALPSETSSSMKENGYNNTFWTVVNGGAISNSNVVRRATTSDGQDLFIYGEILDGPYAAYDDYIKFASDDYGNFLRKAMLNTDGLGNRLNSTKMSSSNWGFTDYQPYSSSDQKGIVTWVESHDTYCNEHKSASMSSDYVRFAWAIAAAREKGTPLFFNRPYGSTNDKAHYWGKNQIGIRGDDQFFHPEVVAANKFRNAMVGETETMYNINSNNKILQIDRGTKGTCIVNIDSQGYDINTYTSMANGTYYDSVSGNVFNVTNHYITGHINAKSVATMRTGREHQ